MKARLIPNHFYLDFLLTALLPRVTMISEFLRFGKVVLTLGMLCTHQVQRSEENDRYWSIDISCRLGSNLRCCS